jgi:hypothetical protein
MGARCLRVGRRSKYGAVKTLVDGVKFDSGREARRYQELKLLQKAGHIRNLELQPVFTLHAPTMDDDEPLPKPSERLGCYRGDFRYELSYTVSREGGPPVEHWRVVVEDVKGFKTPLYRWKKRHVEAQYGIEVAEV